jgi:hypothetical protein
MTRTTTAPVDRLHDFRLTWWLGAVVFFVVGDLVTTLVGLRLPTVVEANPVAARLISGYGVGSVLPWKLGVFGAFYGLSRVVPAPHSIGVPLGLCALGIVVTAWNSRVILAAVI